ncbi:MAG: hypothetical protein Tsb0020_03880 [Haliangiales bacterium]
MRKFAALAVLAALCASASSAGGAEPDHDIVLPARVEASAAAPGEGSFSLTIAPRPGYRVSADAPLIIAAEVVDEATGLVLRRQRYRRRHAADPRAAAPRFDIGYRVAQPGRYQVQLELTLWVCARRTCRPVRASRVVEIDAR